MSKRRVEQKPPARRPLRQEPDPPRDPGGNWERAVRKLAKDANVDAEALLEEFEERAAIIEYMGETDRPLANARAFDLVRDRLFPQRDLLDAEAA